MYEIVHLKTRHPSGMMRMTVMVTQVGGFKSTSIWTGLLNQQLKKKTTACLLLHLIHSVPQLLVFIFLFYGITNPMDPCPGFLVLTHIDNTCSGHKPNPSGWNPKELLELVLPPAPCLPSPTPPQLQWKTTSSFPIQHIGSPVVYIRQPWC